MLTGPLTPSLVISTITTAISRVIRRPTALPTVKLLPSRSSLSSMLIKETLRPPRPQKDVRFKRIQDNGLARLEENPRPSQILTRTHCSSQWQLRALAVKEHFQWSSTIMKARMTGIRIRVAATMRATTARSFLTTHQTKMSEASSRISIRLNSSLIPLARVRPDLNSIPNCSSSSSTCRWHPLLTPTG